MRRRMTLAAALVLVTGIATVTFVLLARAESDTLAQQRDHELREAARTAAVVGNRLGQLQRALAATAGLFDAATLKDAQAAGRVLADARALQGMFATLTLVAPNGDVLHAVADGVSSRPAVNSADRPYFQQTIERRQPVISAPLVSRVTGRPAVVLTQPLLDNGTLHGVLAGVLALDDLGLLRDLVESDSGKTALVAIVDSEGRLLAHPERQRVLGKVDADARLAGVNGQWQAQVRARTLRLLDQGSHIVALAPVPGTDWSVWRSLPEEQVLGPLRRAQQRALLWSLAVLAVAALAVHVLIGMLLDPLDRLKQRAGDLFNHQLDPDAGWPEGPDEIVAIARVLRRVAADRSAGEARNAQVLARLESVMSAAPDGILFTRGQRFELVSAKFCRLIGRSEAELIGQETRLLFASDADYAGLGESVREAFTAGLPYEGELRMRRADGGIFWGRLRGNPVTHGVPEAGTIWTVSDATAQIEAREQLEWSATHDALTELVNRKAFERRLTRVIAGQPSSWPAALVMIDLDHFKPINDSAGHAAGDEMLKAVAHAIRGPVRGSDVAARLGGDEFALLLEGCAQQDALRIATQVRAAIAAIRLPWQGGSFTVGASLGVAMLQRDTSGAAEWLRRADSACYEAKAAGRGAIYCADTAALAP